MTVCPVCGETSPEPLWMCLPRLLGTSKPNEHCDYSQEGERRIADALNATDPAARGVVPSPEARGK